jgi:histidinol-phosphate/aromatic aminotransferase/cobyric acid decarboxylase-like protein/choline kinase
VGGSEASRPAAVILAAGLGLRLRPHTSQLPKALTPLGRERLLERTLRLLAEQGVAEAWIVTGHAADRIESFVRERDWGLDIRLLPNPHYATANNILSVAAAREVLESRDTLLVECDVAFSGASLAALLACQSPNAMLVSPYSTYMDGAVVTADDRGMVSRRLLPDRLDPDPEWLKTLNITRLSRDFSRDVFLPLLDSVRSAGSKLYYDDLIGIAVDLKLAEFAAVVAPEDSWFEVDNVADLKIARDLFGALEEEALTLQGRHGGYWKFPTFQDSCLLVNPWFPTPEFMAELLGDGERLVRSYPSGQADQAILAERAFGVSADFLAIGNGASELILAALDLMPGVVVMSAPSFEEYYNRLPAGRLSLHEGAEPWHRADPAGLAAHADRAGAGALIVVNPENPTGAMIGRQELLELVAAAGRAGRRVLVDESFADFPDPGERFTLLDDALLEANPHLLVLKSISKSYGVPGIRLGLVAGGDRAAIAALRQRLAIWNIGSHAERFLELLPRYWASYEASLDRLAAQRARAAAMLAGCSFLDPKPSAANYHLCEVAPPWTARALVGELLSGHRIIAKDCTGKRGVGDRQCVRFAVGDDRALGRLSEALAALDRQGGPAARRA